MKYIYVACNFFCSSYFLIIYALYASLSVIGGGGPNSRAIVSFSRLPISTLLFNSAFFLSSSSYNINCRAIFSLTSFSNCSFDND